jgi:hypothetical protein
MVNRKSVDLAETAIVNLREAVDKCNTGAILHAASVSKHLEDGFYFDKSINSDKYSELDLKLADLMDKFRNNCSCNKSQM